MFDGNRTDRGVRVDKARGAPVSRSAPLCSGHKPNSVPARLLKARRRWSFISRRDRSRRAARWLSARVRPIPETGPGFSSATGQAARRLCLALHRMGFIVPRRLPAGRWAFTPPFHPCRNACSSASRRSVFCDTFHRPELSLRSPACFPRHAALWCSDFPLPPKRERPSTRRQSSSFSSPTQAENAGSLVSKFAGKSA